ncbi:hypothetical protein HOLleu_19970 [Holothuria leucospilota]|uniref:Ig-like domain-containing protein n=1 Tax=Holothuria leucospilota TaxID=206669 RepID=A0A9Q1C0D5_HOLLE|nr:hypothetical protein HOLleu_19970 [Holothuria leucospilota]
MLFRLRKETAFTFILWQIICFSSVTSSFLPRNLTIDLEERGPEKVDRRRWRRDDIKRQLCKTERIRPIVTYPGESLSLKCSTCGKKFSQISVWNIHLTGTKKAVKLSALKRKDVVRDDPADLSITSISPELGGTYTCVYKDETQGIYEVIVKTLPKFQVVFGQTPKEDTSKEVGLFTRWGAWTKCSAAKCGTPGERSRIGLCSYRVRRKMYADGVPCRSSIVGQQTRGEIQNIPDKKLFQSCQKKCSGDYSKSSSLSDKMPRLPPIVTQKALYAKAGEAVSISCSGVSVVAYVRWEVDGTMIRQVDLHKEGDKRLSIDAFHTLHFKELRDTDEGMYGCWHNDDLQHIYKLKIVKPLPNTKGAEGGTLWVGIVLTFIVIAVIAIGVIKAYCLKRKVVKRRTIT